MKLSYYVVNMEYLQEFETYRQYFIPLALAFIFMVISVVLVLYIIHLRGKLNNFENPKYGFLGKNLYPLIGLITLGSVVIFAGFGMLTPETPDSQADLQVEGKISAQVTSQTLALVNVDLSFVPFVSGTAWGSTGDEFDIYWELIGKQTYTKHELQKSATNPSGINISLPKDNYHVKITVVYEGRTYKFEDRLSY